MNRTILLTASIVLLISSVFITQTTAESSTPKLTEINGFIDHGIAVPVSRSRGIACSSDANGNSIIMVWLSDHRECRSMLIIDANTGNTRQYPTPIQQGRDAPFAIILSSQEKFYSHFQNTFMEFDPNREKFTFSGSTTDRVAMSITEDKNGVIWAGTYPGSYIISYDPKTKKLTDHGQINKETWPQYPGSIAVDSDGWVYIGIGNVLSQIMAYNPETKQKVPIVPQELRKKGPGSVFLAENGKVYGNAYGQGPWYILSRGKAMQTDAPTVAKAPIRAGSQIYVHGQLPDGRTIQKIDVPAKWVDIKNPKSGKVKRLKFDYESEGAELFSLTLGPDDQIYGSTGHPLRIYRFNPDKNAFSHNSLLNFMGHLNAMTVQHKLLYGVRYGDGAGTCYEYNPRQPWADADPNNPNPRVVFSAGIGIVRPHVIYAYPDGIHLIMAGTPGYGYSGGGMIIHNLKTKESIELTHEDLILNQSTISLTSLPDGNLIGGTTIHPGTGGETLTKEAQLYMMDFKTHEITYKEVIVPGAITISDLLLSPQGLVFGIASGPVLFVFDPKTKTVVHSEKLDDCGAATGGQGPDTLLMAPDKNIYALFTQAIVKIDPITFNHTILAKPPEIISIGNVLYKHRLYYTSGSHIFSYEIPGLK